MNAQSLVMDLVEVERFLADLYAAVHDDASTERGGINRIHHSPSFNQTGDDHIEPLGKILSYHFHRGGLGIGIL